MEHATGSPLWWIEKLGPKLDARAKIVTENEDYYDGDHPLPQPPPGASSAPKAEALRATQYLAKMAVTNWVRLVAKAPAGRLRVDGFRIGDAKAHDAKAMAIWSANHLDADSRLSFGTGFQTGSALFLVWPDPNGGLPSITPEHPSEVIVAYAAGSFRRRVAALKRWVDDDGYVCATLYLPDKVYKYRSTRKSESRLILPASAAGGTSGWTERRVAGESWPLLNPFKAVPVVELRANRTLRPAPYGGGFSEFETVKPIQDRINKNIADRLATAEAQAFRQRVIAGWDPLADVDVDDEQAVAKAMHTARMRMGPSLQWLFEDSETKVTELAQAEFKGFIEGTDADVRAMLAITSTPLTMNPSNISNIGEGTMKALEVGLVAKCQDHRDNFGEELEELMALAFMATDTPLAPGTPLEVLWADLERRTWGEQVDAVVKMKSLDVPRRALWERLPDVTPTELDRWEAMAAQDALTAAMQPQPPAQAAGAGDEDLDEEPPGGAGT